MPVNAFVSFDHDDHDQVQGFRGLIKNPNHRLEFNDHSLKEPVNNTSGQPLKFLPTDPPSKPVRDEIISKFNKSSKLIVLIGCNTHQSEWVKWEIDTFYAMKKNLYGDKVWKRIRGMKLKGSENMKIPAALTNKSTETLLWNPEELDKWLDPNPDY